jgi:hypothetical protein
MNPSGRSGWTLPSDLRAQVQRLWDRGRLLAGVVDAEPGLFPLRLTLKTPSPREFSDRFDEARTWAQALSEGAGAGYRIVAREVRHRVLGVNRVPDEAWVDSLDDALRLIGRRRDAHAFGLLLGLTRERQPALLAWLRTHPLRALALEDDWLRLLEVVGWMQSHPRPGIYLRQVDLPGIHSKFIETHRATLGQLLDLALPAQAIVASAGAVADFAGRYGFRVKSPRVRLRNLDPGRSLLGTETDEDLSVPAETFAQLSPACSHVFITENEVNFLAFPAVADAIVVFGAGYGFDALSTASWLQSRKVRYWGDIDTHGFAILDQLRAHLAHAQSFLMDRETLVGHRLLWTEEPQPTLRDLPRLQADERALYDDLRWKRLGDGQVRLEQERIGYRRIGQALAACGCGID